MKGIEGRTDIVKDQATGAIININTEGHRAAVSSSKARELAKTQMITNTNDINSIKEELGEIKHLMKQVLGSFADNGK